MTQLICLTYLRSFKHLPFKPSYVLSKKPDDNSSATRNFSVSSENGQRVWDAPQPWPCCPQQPPPPPCPPCPPPPAPTWPWFALGALGGAATLFFIDKYCEYLKKKAKEAALAIKRKEQCRNRYFAALGLLFIIFILAVHYLFNHHNSSGGDPKKKK